MKATANRVSEISVPAARLAIAASVAVVLLLAALHVLSPEFDPSWRVVSEYANGQYPWVLSLMFVVWAVSSWALAYAIRSQLGTTAGKVGLVLLVVAGLGGGMASIFDINHPLHGLASLFGVLGLPTAAMLISVSLSRTQPWSASRTALLWTANLTWATVLLMIAALIVMGITFTRAGGDPSLGPPEQLPAGVIAVVGYANRLVVLCHLLWTATVAWLAIRFGQQKLP